ncbi:MAG: hypothetical protein D6731_05555 [Planctomycetota bacterium]|nr:MAG: hypothetical protein D6731_05555 [Planctomycetota bacterium]
MSPSRDRPDDGRTPPTQVEAARWELRELPLPPGGDVLAFAVEGPLRGDDPVEVRRLEFLLGEGLGSRRPRGLVLDLRRAPDACGTACGALLLRLASGARGEPRPVVLVVAPAQRAAWRALLDSMGRKSERWLHPDLPSARAALACVLPGGSCDP